MVVCGWWVCGWVVVVVVGDDGDVCNDDDQVTMGDRCRRNDDERVYGNGWGDGDDDCGWCDDDAMVSRCGRAYRRRVTMMTVCIGV